MFDWRVTLYIGGPTLISHGQHYSHSHFLLLFVVLISLTLSFLASSLLLLRASYHTESRCFYWFCRHEHYAVMLGWERGALVREKGHDAAFECMHASVWLWLREGHWSGCISINLAALCGTLSLPYMKYFLFAFFPLSLSSLLSLFSSIISSFMLYAEPFLNGGQV